MAPPQQDPEKSQKEAAGNREEGTTIGPSKRSKRPDGEALANPVVSDL
jgi:hypothetical protein